MSLKKEKALSRGLEPRGSNFDDSEFDTLSHDPKTKALDMHPHKGD